MQKQSAQAITAAIQSCLDECRHSDSPLAAVAETVERLRREGWREIDVRRVEKVVLKVLFGVLLEDYGPENHSLEDHGLQDSSPGIQRSGHDESETTR